MGRKIYLGIIYFIAIVCMIIGISVHMLDSFSNTPISDIGNLLREDKNLTEKTEVLSSFENINLELDVMSVTFHTGSEYKIYYKCSDILIPLYEVKDNTLYVTQEVNWNLKNSSKCELEITIPSGITPNLTASLDVGDLTAEYMPFHNLEITTDVGDINLTNSSSTYANITSDVGDIDLVNFNSPKNILTANVGDIDLEGCSFETLDINSHLGDVDVLDIKGNKEDYSCRIKTDLGDVDVNGHDYKREYINNNNSEKFIEISVSTGDIDMTFQ